MGANAQTSVPAFTTGQVLTAQQQTEINTGVPVFATTTTRDAAFGGTGEKVLAEGQLAYIEASDVVQYYDGTTWATLAPATPSAFVYLTGTTFSAVSSVSLPTSTFSSTYQNYKVIFIITAASANNQASLRFRTSGTDNSNASYHGSFIGEAAGSGITADTNAGTSMALGYIPTSNPRVSFVFDVMAPQETAATMLSGQFVGMNSNWTVNATLNGGGYFANTTSFDSLTLIPGSGTITGNYRVYAYSNS